MDDAAETNTPEPLSPEVESMSLARLQARAGMAPAAIRSAMTTAGGFAGEIVCKGPLCNGRMHPQTDFFKGNRKQTLLSGEVVYISTYCKKCDVEKDRQRRVNKSAQANAGVLATNARKKPGADS